jgi:UDP-N-acetylenolpyruvoylglucosamine reductase
MSGGAGRSTPGGQGARETCQGSREPVAEEPVSEPPVPAERDKPLRRFATVRTGGAAEWFSRVGREQDLVAMLRWASQHGLPVAVLGSGSNLLIADEGVAGLVIKLDGELARIERQGEQMLCGGGARLPAVAAAAARAGLSGIEFGVNIPGTVGGAVRMNANAYGGQLALALRSVRVASADGAIERAPAELGFRYRGSALHDGEVVSHARFALQAAEVESVKATLEQMRAQRHQAQPQGIRTFGSTFKNPDDPQAEGRSAGMLLSLAGCNGLRVGEARFAPKHANFVENLGGASTAEIVALMDEGRRRVLERFGVALQPEVQRLGAVRFPWEAKAPSADAHPGQM